MSSAISEAREKSPAGDEEYSGRISRSVATMEHDEENGMDPSVAGKFLANVSLKKSVPPAKTIGFTYKLFVALNKLLPSKFVNWLVYLIYAK